MRAWVDIVRPRILSKFWLVTPTYSACPRVYSHAHLVFFPMDCPKDALEDSVLCAICKKSLGSEPKVTLGEKGSESINKASRERRDNIHCTAGQLVHSYCRKKYCAPHQIAKLLEKLAS